jgi:membrane-bound lytic murein transglycosylase B
MPRSLPPLAAVLLLLIATSAPAKPAPLTPEAQAFVEEMVTEHGFERAALTELLAGAERRQDILDAISRPAEAKPWYQYRTIFVTEQRARGGLEFWNTNQELLARVEAEYGVPAEILVAIVGVETRYGSYRGNYRVLDALNTLAFSYPRRGGFFRSELEQFLLLTREEGLDPTQAKGSYAGAMGTPQFISSSYRSYAVDFDDDGRRDLWDSLPDILASVANYFVLHGWQTGEPITRRTQPGPEPVQPLVDAGMKPSIPLRRLSAAGFSDVEDLPPDGLTSLVRLELADGEEYWLGLPNFYAITRYNHSNMYAMAVYQLSREILALREAQRPNG